MRRSAIVAVVILVVASWAVIATRSSVAGEPMRATTRRVVVHVLGGDGKPVTSVAGSLDAVADSGSSASSAWQSMPGADLTFDVAGETEAWITIAGAFDATGTRLPWGQARYGPLAEHEGEVTIQLPPSRTVEGRIYRPDGDGFGGVKIRVRMDVRLGGADLDGRTRPDGTFAVAGLGDGPYALKIEPPLGHLAPAPIIVRGGDRGVVVRLARAPSPIVRVVDAKGEPVGGALVEVEQMESDPVTSVTSRHRIYGEPEDVQTTSSDGRFRLPALDPLRPLRLRVTPPASRADLAQYRRDSWIPDDITVTLPAGFVVRGRVVDAAHEPVPNTAVTATWGTSGESSAFTDEQGHFELRAIPAGRVTVRVDAIERAEAVAEPARPVVSLMVARRANLRVVLEEPPSRLGKRFRVAVSSGSLPDGRSTRFVSLNSDGVAQFDGLAAERRYRLLVGPTDDDRVAYLADVRPIEGAVRVRLVPGGTLSGRIRTPVGATDLEVRVDDGPILWRGVVREDGCFEITGVPEGTWTVVASAQAAGALCFGSARIATGSRADIEIAK